jgi:uroporphyrin-III C-methyltransferase/precorrin-2 dehydrogenase/sirohydrochlorin ferrochelatase
MSAPAHEPVPDVLLPVFLRLAGRRVVVVGAGAVAAGKLPALLATGAAISVVAPEVHGEIARAPVTVHRRPFAPADLDGAWFVLAAATAEVNGRVREAAEERRVFVNAVDDPASASAYTGGVLRRGGVTIAVSTEGRAPALAGLLREGLEAVLPPDVGTWVSVAHALRDRQRRAGLPVHRRRPALLDALNGLYGEEGHGDDPPRGRGGAAVSGGPGVVSLVGAGPGDPGLVTLEAARRLAEADVVLYDALVTAETLALAGRATRICVGKRAGRPGTSQEAIHAIMIRAARRGRRVVRLKCGDPFVLGRGGEEAQALAAAGVPCEVVPGVSAAVAAPALAGIPVTHRRLASAFVVVSGHAEPAYRPVLESVAPYAATVVVLMGKGRRAGIAELLLARGWARHTPCAVVLGASTPAERSWLGPLSALATAEIPDEGLPGTIVIGDVVALAKADAAPAAAPAVRQAR